MEKNELLEEEITRLKAVCDNQVQIINDRNGDITTANDEINKLKMRVASLVGQVDILTPDAIQVPSLKKELATAIEDRRKSLEANASLYRTISQLKRDKSKTFLDRFINKLRYL